MSTNKPTVVIGASDNPERYAYKATISLRKHGHTVYPVGLREGSIDGVSIYKDRPVFENIDTVTLYVGPAHQPAWYDYIKALKPKRLLLNPGTENQAITDFAVQNNIEPVEACTLVLLSIGDY